MLSNTTNQLVLGLNSLQEFLLSLTQQLPLSLLVTATSSEFSLATQSVLALLLLQ
jgi:hypothetical protein